MDAFGAADPRREDALRNDDQSDDVASPGAERGPHAEIVFEHAARD